MEFVFTANPNVPGPASYLPKIAATKPSAPQYSLKGRYKQAGTCPIPVFHNAFLSSKQPGTSPIPVYHNAFLNSKQPGTFPKPLQNRSPNENKVAFPT